MIKYPYLDDMTFLKYVDELQYKKQYVRIIILDKYERPIEELAAHVKDGGSVSIDGSSNIRRTSSLSLVMDTSTEEKMKEVIDLLTLNKKIEIEVGFKNITKGVFPNYADYDIIWYPIGIFYTQSPSFNHGTDGLSITLPLSDKMCLLTGDSGGTFPADVDLDKMETYVPEKIDDEPTGRMILQYDVPIPIKQIVRELVNHWGGEQLGKIIIDFPDEVKVVQFLEQLTTTLDNDTKASRYIHTTPVSSNKNIRVGVIKQLADNEIREVDIPAGKDVGFIYSDFTYPSGKGLTAAKGSAITGALDSIKNSLENYEYFYDRYGNFIFQEIKNYLNTSQSTTILNTADCLQNGTRADYTLDRFRTKAVYSFDNSNIIASYSNNPQYELIKNDFLIWGQNSAGYPIRYHVAIDELPIKEDKEYKGYCFLKMPMIAVDIGYTKEDTSDTKYYTDTIVALKKVNTLPASGLLGVYYYYNNTVYYYDGYEFLSLAEEVGDSFNKNYIVYDQSIYISKENWRTQLFLDGVVSENDGIVANEYYSELKTEWPKIIDVNKLFENESNKYLTFDDIKSNNLDETGIVYYLDILDTSEKISQFSVSKIGRRTEAIKVDTVNCIFENDIPEYIYINTKIHNFTKDANGVKTNKTEEVILNELMSESVLTEFNEQIEKIISQQYTPVLLTIEDYKELQNGGTLFSAYEAAKERIYQCTGYNEKITLDILPIYHLEPNTRISVKDVESGINGDYIINSIEAPLDINSTMSLTCTRALDKL